VGGISVVHLAWLGTPAIDRMPRGTRGGKGAEKLRRQGGSERERGREGGTEGRRDGGTEGGKAGRESRVRKPTDLRFPSYRTPGLDLDHK
jgi:hypothetical protein